MYVTITILYDFVYKFDLSEKKRSVIPTAFFMQTKTRYGFDPIMPHC